MGSDSRLTGPPVVPDKTRTSFLDSARAIAAILVVYTHIYNVFILDHKGVHTPPTDVVDETLVNPLKLNDQGIGAISVPIFFIISGFVVTPIALKMGGKRFGINRFFRIYPLLFFVVTVSAVLIALGRGLLSTKPPDVTVWSFLRNVSLYNFIDRPFGAWVAVAWTLAVEVLFYVLLIALLPLMRRRMWLAIAVELWLVLMLLITYRSLGDEYRAFVINMVYVLIPIMGQAVWAAWTGRIPAWLAGSYVTSAWLLFVWAGNLGVDPEYVPRAFPIAFAMMLFLIGLFAEPYLKQRRVWTELSERTYSIYLLHGTVAFPLMHWGFDRFPLWLTVLIAVTATGLAAEISYRFVESPSHNLARRLSRRRDKPKEETPAADEALDDYEDEFEDDYEEYDDYEAEESDAEPPTERTPPVPAPSPIRRVPPRVPPLQPGRTPAARNLSRNGDSTHNGTLTDNNARPRTGDRPRTGGSADEGILRRHRDSIRTGAPTDNGDSTRHDMAADAPSHNGDSPHHNDSTPQRTSARDGDLAHNGFPVEGGSSPRNDSTPHRTSAHNGFSAGSGPSPRNGDSPHDEDSTHLRTSARDSDPARDGLSTGDEVPRHHYSSTHHRTSTQDSDLPRDGFPAGDAVPRRHRTSTRGGDEFSARSVRNGVAGGEAGRGNGVSARVNGRRRLAEPETEQVSPLRARAGGSIAWPEEQDDPDVGAKSGRHRRDDD